MSEKSALWCYEKLSLWEEPLHDTNDKPMTMVPISDRRHFEQFLLQGGLCELFSEEDSSGSTLPPTPPKVANTEIDEKGLMVGTPF